MPNPSPPLKNLKQFESKWRHEPTKVMRFPAAFEPELKEYCRRLDRGDRPFLSLTDAEIERLIRQYFRAGRQSQAFKNARALVKSALAQANKDE